MSDGSPRPSGKSTIFASAGPSLHHSAVSHNRSCSCINAISLAVVFVLSSASSQTDWTRHPSNPVLRTGGPGTWDQAETFLPSVLVRDSVYIMWYGGDDGVNARTGRASSTDGLTWKKDSLNPVMDVGPAASWDGRWAASPCVLFEGDHYTMWYTGADHSTNFGPIGRATSADGRVWQKDNLNPVVRFGSPDSWESNFVASPTVVFDGTVYRLWYEGRGSSPGIGYATSTDGLYWVKYSQNPVLVAGPAGSWDEQGVGMPMVLLDSGYFHMWYSGGPLNGFEGSLGIGYAVSADGIHWKEYPRNPVLTNGGQGTWEQAVFGSFVRRAGSSFQMWYGGTASLAYQIGYATSPRSPATIVTLVSSLDLNNVRPGAFSDTIRFVIENWGFTPLSISSVSARHPEFIICDLPALPALIPPFEERSIGVVFHPTQAGIVVMDTVVIASNDSLHPTTTISLRGRGSGESQSAIPGRLYGISASTSAARLFEISKSSGEASPLAQLTPDPPPVIHGFGLRPFDKTLYAAYSSAAGTLLYRVSSAFGDLEPAGTVPLGGVTAMAFSAEDVLYLALDSGRMYRINSLGADTMLVGTPGVVFTGLAFSPTTGMLWGSAHDTVFTIDVASGKPARLGSSGSPEVRSSIAFGPLGTLYGLFDHTLVVIDKGTGGVASFIGATGVSGISAITMRSDLVGSAGDVSSLPAGLPTGYQLFQNYPNPFNPATTIRYDMPKAGHVTIKVFDMLGREVATLIDGIESAGIHTVVFDAPGLASALYYYRMYSGGFTETKKLLVVR